MLGKLIDGILITPSEMEKKKIIITNPSEESLKFNLGYKDLIIDEQPEYDEVTQYIKAVYEETDTTIIQHWEIIEVPNDFVIDEEIIEDIENEDIENEEANNA